MKPASLTAIAVVTLTAALCAAGFSPTRTDARGLTPSQLSRALARGARAKHVPARLDPELSAASTAKPIIVRNGCHVGRAGVKSKPCIYGDTTAPTSIVLFGDSHAAAWFPALDLIARQQHRRLVVMTKSGCPPAEVDIAAHFRGGAPYLECAQWRTNAKAQIAALHPALVVVATASYLEAPEAGPSAGVPTGHGGAWEDGWAAIFAFVRASALRVVFISDVPTLQLSAPRCISTHRSNLRRCNTKRSAAARQPAIKAQEIAIARRAGVGVIDPLPWFCARTTCPVIVSHIVVYRDSAHMTPPWSRYIAPVLANAIAPVLRSSG